MGGVRGWKGQSGWEGAEVSFPGGGTQENQQRQCVEGKVFLVVKIRAKASRWNQRVQGRELGRLRGHKPGLQEAGW